jgi:hypothetical protein
MERNAKDLILEDRLLLSEPEFVRDWLEKANSSTGSTYSFYRDYDAEIELSLLKRGHPLVALALAQFGTNTTVLSQLWAQADESPEKHTGHLRALRLAILSNQNIEKTLSLGGPVLISIIGTDNFTSLLSQASDEELQALGQNPRLAFLEDLYEKSGTFESLTDDRWQYIIRATIGNTRLFEEYDSDDDTDGYSEYLHNAVFSAVYTLPTIVPVTKEWAKTLSWLLDKTLPHLPSKTTLADIESTMARWRVPLFEKPEGTKFYFDPSAKLRTVYGRLYFEYSIKKPVEEIMASDDQATRCAAYAWGELTPEQVKLGAEKDKDKFLEWACSNKNLCRTQVLRDAFRDAARKFGDGEGHEEHRFAYVCAEQHKEHPYWFNDDPYKDEKVEEERLTSDQPVVQPSPELLKLISKMDKLTSKVETIYRLAIILGIVVLWQGIFH